MWVDDMLTSMNSILTSINSIPSLKEDPISCIQLYVYYYGLLILFHCLILLWGQTIYHHRKHWNKPDEQKRIVVLVSIPVVICFVSWVALHVNEDSKTIFLLLDSIKECSAGLAIPMFMGLLQAYMDLDTSKLSPDAFSQKIKGRLVYNVFPVTLVQPRSVLLNLNNLKLMNFWTWQYVVVRLVCTVFMIIFHLGGMYPLWLSWAVFFVLNLSASVAYYTAYAFYRAFVEEFPLLSDALLHIRGILFVCFWQGGVLKVLVAMGIIKSNHFWRQELHNSLLVLEMLMFIGLMFGCYPFGPYIVHHPLLNTESSEPVAPAPPLRRKRD